jgi:hypothetical protein
MIDETKTDELTPYVPTSLEVEILSFIYRMIGAIGRAPIMREIGDHLGIPFEDAFVVVRHLEGKGVIVLEPDPRRLSEAGEKFDLGSAPKGDYVVYFFRDEEVGSIKIGRTLHLLERFHQVQRDSKAPLSIVGIISGLRWDVEARVHQEFRHLRIRGEYFRPGPDLLEFIRRNVTPWESVAHEFKRHPDIICPHCGQSFPMTAAKRGSSRVES